MTDPNLTHLYFLLDRSGSMQSIKDDTEGGFDAFIAEQHSQPGECRVTLAQFDDRYEEVYRDVPAADVPPLSLSPRGSTAPPRHTGTAARRARRRASSGRRRRGWARRARAARPWRGACEGTSRA